MNVTLKTVTPIHVGNGEKLYDLDYVVTSGFYYRISQGMFLKFLKNYPEHIEDYSNWITQTTSDLENLKAAEQSAKKKKQKGEARDFNQKFNQIKTNFNLLGFSKSIGKEAEFKTFLNENSEVFKIPFNKKLNGEVRGLLTTATEKPYLAGSTIKGSIRTALFYHYLMNYANIPQLLRQFDRELAKAKKTRNNWEKDKIKKHFADEIEQNAFYCQHNCTKNGKLKSNDEKLDIFKFLIVSDGRIDKQTKDCLSVEDIKLYLVKKEQKRGSKDFTIEAKEQKQAPFVEAIKPNIEIQTTINFNIEFLFSLKDKLTDKGIKTQNGYQWIGLKERVQQVFGLDISTLTANNLEEKRGEVLRHIKKAIQQFSERQIKENQKWLEHFKKNDKEGYAPKVEEGFWLVNHLAKSQNLIHLGFGTGFTGMTALLYVLDNEDLKNKYREVMEIFGIGNAPNNRGKYVPNPDRFPKSKRLAKGRNEIKPLGWLTFVDDKTPKHFADLKYEAEQQAKQEAMKLVKPSYFKGKINHRSRVKIEGIITKAGKLGKPNEVQLYISEDNKPIVQLMGYRNAIEVGRVIIVSVQFNRQKKVTNTSFSGFKKSKK